MTNSNSSPTKTNQQWEAEMGKAWNLLSVSLVGMKIADPRWKPAVDWLNANRHYQTPIPRLPNTTIP